MYVSEEMKEKIKNEGYEITNEMKSLNTANIGDILLDTGEPPVAYKIVDKKQNNEEITVLTLTVVVGDPENGLPKGYTDSIGYGKNEKYNDMFVLKPIKTATIKIKANNQLDRQSFKQQVLNNGYITIDSDGALNYVVTKINDNNFRDINPTLKKQLEDEGKYNSWIGFITSEQAPYSIQCLPIYGSATRYITKWFTNTAEQAIDQDLRDKQMGLLQRANKYIENNKTAKIKRLKKAAGQFTYIATAPIRFTVRPRQSGMPYNDDHLGIEFFNELQNAVEGSMSEIGIGGLAEYIDMGSPLYDIVESIVVDVKKQGENIISKTTIKTNEELTDDEIEYLKDYITGQFSDGWGEGFEQNAIADWDEEEETEEWDEEEQENYKDSYTETYEILAHFWNSKNFKIDIKKV